MYLTLSLASRPSLADCLTDLGFSITDYKELLSKDNSQKAKLWPSFQGFIPISFLSKNRQTFGSQKSYFCLNEVSVINDNLNKAIRLDFIYLLFFALYARLPWDGLDDLKICSISEFENSHHWEMLYCELIKQLSYAEMKCQKKNIFWSLKIHKLERHI